MVALGGAVSKDEGDGEGEGACSGGETRRLSRPDGRLDIRQPGRQWDEGRRQSSRDRLEE